MVNNFSEWKERYNRFTQYIQNRNLNNKENRFFRHDKIYISNIKNTLLYILIIITLLHISYPTKNYHGKLLYVAYFSMYFVFQLPTVKSKWAECYIQTALLILINISFITFNHITDNLEDSIRSRYTYLYMITSYGICYLNESDLLFLIENTFLISVQLCFIDKGLSSYIVIIDQIINLSLSSTVYIFRQYSLNVFRLYEDKMLEKDFYLDFFTNQFHFKSNKFLFVEGDIVLCTSMFEELYNNHKATKSSPISKINFLANIQKSKKNIFNNLNSSNNTGNISLEKNFSSRKIQESSLSVNAVENSSNPLFDNSLLDELLKINPFKSETFSNYYLGEYWIYHKVTGSSIRINNNDLYDIYVSSFRLSDNLDGYLVDIYPKVIKTIVQDNVQSELESQLQSKQKMLSNIAHEFKTPLICLVSLTNILKDKMNSEEQIHHVENISSLSNYIQFLISDFIQTNQDKELDITLKPVDLGEVLQFCHRISLSLNSLYNEENSVLIDLIIFKGLKRYQIVSDEVRLKQIILNFLSNSIKFTKSGKVTLQCDIDDSGNLFIKIQDTGMGMKTDDVDKVLRKNFGQLKVDRKVNTMGTGLGLNIVNNLIKKLGYSFDFQSQVGVGTVATIILSNNVTYLGDSDYLDNKKTIIENKFNLTSLCKYLEKTYRQRRISTKSNESFKMLKNTSILNKSNLHISRIDNNFFYSPQIKSKSSKFVRSHDQVDREDKVSKKYYNIILVVDDNKFLRASVRRLLEPIIKEFSLKYVIHEGLDGVDIVNKIINRSEVWE